MAQASAWVITAGVPGPQRRVTAGDRHGWASFGRLLLRAHGGPVSVDDALKTMRSISGVGFAVDAVHGLQPTKVTARSRDAGGRVTPLYAAGERMIEESACGSALHRPGCCPCSCWAVSYTESP